MRTERIIVITVLLTLGLSIMTALQQADTTAAGGAVLLVLGAVLLLVAAWGTVWLRSGAGTMGSNLLPVLRLPLLRLPADVFLPVLLVLGYAFFLQIFAGTWLQVVLLGIAALSLFAVYWSQANVISTGLRYFGLAQTVLTICSHLAAFLLYSAIYGLKVRALYSATAVGVVTALLLYETLGRDARWHETLHRRGQPQQSDVRLFALAGGLVAGQLTWGLNYWAALTTLVGGAFLLLAFYVMYGLCSSFVERRLNRGSLVEYGTVAAVGLVVIFASAFMK